MTAPVLHAEAVSMDYGAEAIIDSRSLTAHAGDIIALTGENGSGKSTLLRGLAGLQDMTCGRYELLGQAESVNSHRHRALTCAIMDSSSWLPELTIAEHLHTVHDAEQSLFTPEDALTVLGLDHLGHRLPYQVSSGQRQRAALSLALVRPWTVLFLDEPEQRLDSHYRAVLAETLVDLVSVDERAIVMATHSRELLEACGAREVLIGETGPAAAHES